MGAWENGQSKIMCQFIAHAYFTTHWWFLFPPKKEKKKLAQLFLSCIHHAAG
jgi:hypothetical protein